MIEIIGKHNSAVCFCSEIEETAEKQIKAVCDLEEFADCKIRIMPDVHAGAGCTIGTAMTITGKVVPNMVGVDIGCGMETVKIAEKEIDFTALDSLIRAEIPCGMEIRSTEHEFNSQIDLTALHCREHEHLERAQKSIGTLGGGNHFIEFDRDKNGNLYLVIHSGSRYLGKEVAKYYQDESILALNGKSHLQVREVIAQLKAEGRHKKIFNTVAALKAQNHSDFPKELAYAEGELFDNYIHDMKIIQNFAAINRRAMTDVILSGMNLTECERFTTIHNYIDTDEMILRKGAVSAKAGEKLLIPINMRDGSLICIGKGNEEWNFSSPHGAGRIMSRKKAICELSLDEFRAQMQGVYSTCILKETLDESPMAYKNMDSIVSQISPTAEIIDVIKPVYNFKAASFFQEAR